MGALFGKPPKKTQSRVTQQDKAVLVRNDKFILYYIYVFTFRIAFSFNQQLKQQRDKLKQYQKRIELSLEIDREMARKCLASGRKE